MLSRRRLSYVAPGTGVGVGVGVGDGVVVGVGVGVAVGVGGGSWRRRCLSCMIYPGLVYIA